MEQYTTISPHKQKFLSERNLARNTSIMRQGGESATSISGDRRARRTKQKSLPIHFRMRRSLSEDQLCQDEAIAESRDFAMFSRIVSGINHSKSDATDSLTASIIKTRHDESFAPERTKSPRSVAKDQNGPPLLKPFVLAPKHSISPPDLQESTFRPASDSDDFECMFELDL